MSDKIFNYCLSISLLCMAVTAGSFSYYIVKDANVKYNENKCECTKEVKGPKKYTLMGNKVVEVKE